MIQIFIEYLLSLESLGGDGTDIDRYWLVVFSPWTLQAVMIQILIDYLLTLEPPGGDDTDIDWLSPHLGASRWWWYRYWLIGLLTLEPPGGNDTDIDWLSPHLGASRWSLYRYWLFVSSPWSLQVVMIQILIDYLLTLEPPGGDDTDTDWLSPHLRASRWWWYRYWLIGLLTLEPPGGDDTYIVWLAPHLGASRWWWYRYWLIISSPWSL